MIVALFHLVPILGVRGGAWALLIAEFCSAVGYVFYAARWLKEHGMSWPMRSFVKINLAVVWLAIVLSSLLYFNGSDAMILMLALIGFAVFFGSYWADLPVSAKGKINQVIFARLPFLRNRI